MTQYHTAIQQIDGLDLIPREWLHITVQGLAFIEDISTEDLASVLKTIRNFSAFVTNIHPARFANSHEITGTWARILWDHAQHEGIPVWHAARFLDFINARLSVRFDDQTWDGTTLAFDYVGPVAAD